MAYFLVRSAKVRVKDSLETPWEARVWRCSLPGNRVRFRVCLHGPDMTVLVQHYDVHLGRYGSASDETRVFLSAAECACHQAAALGKMFDWQLTSVIGALI